MKLEDVARLAKVSKSAASLALNNKPGVSEKTRLKIQAVAKQNNYVPLRNYSKVGKKKQNENAIQLRFIASTSEEVITDDYEKLPFFSVLLSYLSTEISDKNYIMIINKLSKNNILDELTELEKEKPSDGIIILGTNLTGAHIAPVTTAFSNLVVIDTACNCINCNTITMNNYLGAFEAVDYLIKIGHRKIGYIKGTPRINNFIERRRGFKDALWKNGIDSKDSPKYYLPGMKIQIIDEKLNQFLEFVNSVTAIFCEDDYIAISVIKTLNQCGIQVPRDVSVIGFDDIPESQVTTPELTTIQVPIKQIAKETINLIEHGFEDENPYKKQIYVNPYLVLRNSVQSLE